jgi:hypothetical protein
MTDSVCTATDHGHALLLETMFKEICLLQDVSAHLTSARLQMPFCRQQPARIACNAFAACICADASVVPFITACISHLQGILCSQLHMQKQQDSCKRQTLADGTPAAEL